MIDTYGPVFACCDVTFLGSEHKEGVGKKSGKPYSFWVHRFLTPNTLSTIEVSGEEQIECPVRSRGILHIDIVRQGYNNVVKLIGFEVV